MPEALDIYRKESPEKAQSFLLKKAKEQGFPGIINTDPFHPGFFVNINQHTNGEIRNYFRTENFQTGEVITSYRDNDGVYTRRMFVSRESNVIMLSLSGPGVCELEFPKLNHNLIKDYISVSTDWVGYHNVYVKGKGGYDAGVRIARKGGNVKVIGNKVQIVGAEEIVLKMQIVPWKTPLPKEQSEAWAYSPENPDFDTRGKYVPNPSLHESSQVAFLTETESKSLLPAVKRMLMHGSAEYQELLDKHIPLHQELFNRVEFQLNTGNEYQRTVTDLLKEAEKTNSLPSALMEKMYDAGKYMLICASGELLPNLHGIWTGTWAPRWSGDFTLDTNVQSALASACSLNLTELQEGYFRLIENFFPEWRLNAMRMYGCRGVLTNARASNTALLLHWGPWPGNFWTAGCGWLASFFVRYVDYTQDLEFLENRCLPYLKEVALFYKDFLKETVGYGKMEFIPSYNPETHAGINATMDIAVAKEVLTNLIRFSRQLKRKKADIYEWESLLNKLPDYPVNNGTLTEWPDKGSTSGHRHHSQLYPCFQSFDPLFETDMRLRAAAQSAIHLKINGLDGEKGAFGERTSFSRIQGGISAAYLGMAEEAYGRLAIMASKRNMYTNLITSHDPNGQTFNTDGNGGIPQIVATMLAFSRVDKVELLRALPSAWPSGSIKGLNLACGCTVDMVWNKGTLVSAVFHAMRDTEFAVHYKEKKQTLHMKRGDVLSWKL